MSWERICPPTTLSLQHAQDCSESNNSGGTTYWQGHVGSNLSWCILFKESVLLHWSNEILTFSNVSMISECSWILQCTQNPFNVIWKKYEKPCVISTVFNLFMISDCSGILICGQHSFNMIWYGIENVWKTLCGFNIFNLAMIPKCSGVEVKWAPYATYKSIEKSKLLIFH